MLKEYPSLEEVAAIQFALSRHMDKPKRLKDKLKRKEVMANKVIKFQPKLGEKVVECYYCTGEGRTSMGMSCPNCGGKGSFSVTGKGIGN
jgi:RecJ-like exonuclease